MKMYQQYVDTVIYNLMNAKGTTYNHNVNGSYKLPFDKFLLDFCLDLDIRVHSVGIEHLLLRIL